MKKEELFAQIREKYVELKGALKGTDIEKIRNLTLDPMPWYTLRKYPEERGMRVLEEGGVTTDFRSVWLLVFWGRLTRGGMILIPMTDHHMMHLSPCLNNLPILD